MSVVHEELHSVPGPGGKKDIAVLVSRPAETAFQDVCVVLGHGASGDASSGNLPAIAARLAAAGVPVVRYSCGGQLPARVKALQAVLDSGIEPLAGVKRWVLAGHSMGGRTACAVARDRPDVAAVVLLSYPLHPPGKQAELRDADLTALQVPVLLVRGTRDAFSSADVWEAAMGRMQSRQLRVCSVEGGDHSLGTKTQAGQQRFEAWMGEVQRFVTGVLGAPAPAAGASAQQSSEAAAPGSGSPPAPAAAKRSKRKAAAEVPTAAREGKREAAAEAATAAKRGKREAAAEAPTPAKRGKRKAAGEAATAAKRGKRKAAAEAAAAEQPGGRGKRRGKAAAGKAAA